MNRGDYPDLDARRGRVKLVYQCRKRMTGKIARSGNTVPQTRLEILGSDPKGVTWRRPKCDREITVCRIKQCLGARQLDIIKTHKILLPLPQYTSQYPIPQ